MEKKVEITVNKTKVTEYTTKKFRIDLALKKLKSACENIGDNLELVTKGNITKLNSEWKEVARGKVFKYEQSHENSFRKDFIFIEVYEV